MTTNELICVFLSYRDGEYIYACLIEIFMRRLISISFNMFYDFLLYGKIIIARESKNRTF